MADSIGRALRDGRLEGEHAPALTIKDTVASPFGPHVFGYVLSQLSSNILAGKSQSKGLVVVAYSQSPLFYMELLKNRGLDDVASSRNCVQILDCYTDPLGWKDRLMNHSRPQEANICKDVKNTDKLFSSIVELGKGVIGQGKGHFSVAIDSVSEMLRHTSMPAVAGLLSNLRTHDGISSIFWLVHSDLHDTRVTSSLEYMSSIVAILEPLIQSANVQKGDLENISLRDENFGKGKFHVRSKRRNGRVRVMSEEFRVEQSGISFTSVSSENAVVNQGLVPKVQFNLHLSEKERNDRSSVVLPFEHQGNGKPIEIYDGRRSLVDGKLEEPFVLSAGNNQNTEEGSKGEIIYFRDSDDERPDSDEDPDDDLDI
ncbi:hypothetical protein ACFE04_006545 [Oxalis oulophora]